MSADDAPLSARAKAQCRHAATQLQVAATLIRLDGGSQGWADDGCTITMLDLADLVETVAERYARRGES